MKTCKTWRGGADCSGVRITLANPNFCSKSCASGLRPSSPMPTVQTINVCGSWSGNRKPRLCHHTFSWMSLFEDVHMDNSSFIKLRQSQTPHSECHGHVYQGWVGKLLPGCRKVLKGCNWLLLFAHVCINVLHINYNSWLLSLYVFFNLANYYKASEGQRMRML